MAERQSAEKQAGLLTTELATLKTQLAACERELAGATTALSELAGKVETAEGRAEEERQTAAQARVETAAVREQADRLRELLRDESGRASAAALEAAVTATRLETAQAAASLTLPEPIDLSSDLGDGVSGVVLPDAAIQTVTREPDGTIVLHHHDTRIRLGDPQHAPARGRALAAALLALSSEHP
ncbi:hypothetical protein ACIBK9_51715 [Nonomuraea sp. NPDC050227]|uniref:hypothetical protein n=1 Tax=Nonomuraea sp. NPDC050227 TaxID=3364360 RepID=UPI00379EBCA8